MPEKPRMIVDHPIGLYRPSEADETESWSSSEDDDSQSSSPESESTVPDGSRNYVQEFLDAVEHSGSKQEKSLALVKENKPPTRQIFKNASTDELEHEKDLKKWKRKVVLGRKYHTFYRFPD